MTKLLTSKEYAARLGIRPQTARRQRMNGRGPRFLRLGAGPTGRAYYREEDVLQWLADQPTFRSTLEEKECSGDSSHEVVSSRRNRASLCAVSKKGDAKLKGCVEEREEIHSEHNHSTSVKSDG